MRRVDVYAWSGESAAASEIAAWYSMQHSPRSKPAPGGLLLRKVHLAQERFVARTAKSAYKSFLNK
jgi:hypothetical protein